MGQNTPKDTQVDTIKRAIYIENSIYTVILYCSENEVYFYLFCRFPVFTNYFLKYELTKAMSRFDCTLG